MGFNGQVSSTPSGYSTYGPFNTNAQQPTQYGANTAAVNTGNSGSDYADVDDVASSITSNINRIKASLGVPSQPVQLTGNSSAASSVSQTDIQWAVQLEEKVQKQNYQPTQQELTKYQNIANAIQAQQTQQTQATQPTQTQQAAKLPPGVTDADVQWALQFEEKVQKQNYQPTQDEITKYQNLSAALTSAAQEFKAQQTQQPQQTTQASGIPANISESEIQWALQLEEKIKSQNYQPTQQELAQYQSIADRLTAGQSASAQGTNNNWVEWSKPFSLPTTPTSSPVSVPTSLGKPSSTLASPSQMQLPVMTNQNFQAQSTLQSPVNMQSQQVQQPQQYQAQVQTVNTVSQADLQWAMQLEEKSQKQNYQPTQAELNRYNDIVNRVTSQQANNTALATGTSTTQNTGLPNQNMNTQQTNQNKNQQTTGFWQKLKTGFSAFMGAMKS